MKYLGNKGRLSEFLEINMNLKNRAGQTALDLFAGTGSVSLLFKNNSLNTVSNDRLSFSSHMVRSILLDKPPNKIVDLNTATRDGFITNNYSEKIGVNIFKNDIAEHIDGARTYLEINRDKFTKQEFSYYLSQIIEAADFRANIMGSYESYYKGGWRKQALKKWAVEDFALVDSHGTTTHKVYNQDVLEFLTETEDSYDFIYFDPPYNTRQYSSVFHVLETISEYDNPEVSGKIRKNINLKDKKSNFSSKIKCYQEFEEMFGESSKKTDQVFLSYSNEGILDIPQIQSLLLKFYKNIDIAEYDYRRFKTNSRKPNKKNKVKEYLINASK